MTTPQASILLKRLTSPAKVASALDWKRLAGASVATLSVHASHLNVSLHAHPKTTSSPQEVTSVTFPLQRGRMRDEHQAQLQNLLTNSNNVAGVVVSWPLQRDTGKLGAACGRTLKVLEEILLPMTTSTNANLQVCLWDAVHSGYLNKADEWGRNAHLAGGGNTFTKKVHLASVEQYRQDESMTPAQVWTDFVHAQWPELKLVLEEYNNHPDESQAPAERPQTKKSLLLGGSATPRKPAAVMPWRNSARPLQGQPRMQMQATA